MSAAAEVQKFLDQFEPAVVAKAQQLAKHRCVRILNVKPDRIEAEVAFEDAEDDDDVEVDVSLRKINDVWRAVSVAKDERQAAAQCAALLEAEAALIAAEDDDRTVQLTLQETVEQKLTRQLSGPEEQFLAKVEKRFERFKATAEIFDHDMVRIQARWPVRNYDPLALWPAPPREVWEFCRFIIAALVEKKLPVPAFIEGIAELDKTRAVLARWRQQESLPQWMGRIRDFLDRELAPEVVGELRLLATFEEVRVQYHTASGEPWHLITAEQLSAAISGAKAGALPLPLASEFILTTSATRLGENVSPVMRLDDVDVAQWLASLLHQPELQGSIVTLDETPFIRNVEPLRWSVDEAASKDGTSKMACFRLLTPDGKPLKSPLRHLPARDPLYLSGDEIHNGPAYFGEGTLVPPVVEFPLEALATEDGILFLERLGLTLPPSLQQRTKRESFKVGITARCVAKADPTGTEHIALDVEAVSTDGRVRQRLSGLNWEVSECNPRINDTIACYDRAPLAEAAQLVDNLRATFDAEINAYRVRVTRAFPEQYSEWARTLPEGVTLTSDENLQTILADPLKATVRFEINETSIDWFDLRLIFEIEGLELKPAELRRLIAAKGGFVRLADGTWRSVQLELTPEQEAMIEGLGINLDELDDQAHTFHLRQLALQKQKEAIPPELQDRIKDRLRKLDLETKPPVPEGLRATLRPYQVEGFQFLAYLTINRFGGILADDMGLGKTMQSIAWILWLRSLAESKTSAPCLVVCPKSVLDVWAVEFAKVAPHLRVFVLREKDTLDLTAVQAEQDVLVLNYAQLRGCIEELSKVQWLAIILDEGQQIKNPDSKVAKAAKQINADSRVVLSGTPLENRLLDLWSLMTFATPGALGDRAYFQKHFDRRKDDNAAARLSARMRPFLLRRTKGQVARELPPRSEENLLSEMSGLQDQLYREQLAAAQHMVLTSAGEEIFRKRRFAVLQALTRLRQICCHPALVRPDAINEESAKLNSLLEVLDQLHDEGHKVLVFSQFVTMLNIIRDRLIGLERPFHYLTGATQNRAEVVDRFQNDSSASVFLLSLKAGGSGLNLTAASYVILYDPWWNPAVENQAIDRAHRIGQTQPVMAYRMLAKNTIEEKIQRLQMTKNIMSSDVLGENGFTRSLERADLEYLFEMTNAE